MIKIELTSEELNNLMIFMERIDLKGKEVPAFNALTYKIQQSVQKSQQKQQDASVTESL